MNSVNCGSVGIILFPIGKIGYFFYTNNKDFFTIRNLIIIKLIIFNLINKNKRQFLFL